MRLTRVALLGFARMADRELTLAPAAGGGCLTFISGPPGSGKTTLLELLIAAKESWGPSGARLPYQPQSRDGQGAKLIAEWSMTSGSVEADAIFDSPTEFAGATDARLEAAMSGYSLSPGFWKLEYMHEGRAIERGPTLAVARAAARVETSAQKYGHLDALLGRRADEGDPAVLERLSRALAPFGMAAARAPHGAGVIVSTPRGERPVSALARSEQQLFLLLAGPLAFGVDRGLLLIDTIEQGLPAAWAAKVPGALRELVPEAQIIATTRFAELAGAADTHIQLR